MLVECLVSNSSHPHAWSSEVSAINFRDAYKVFEGDSIVTKVGCNKFWSSGHERVLHWEAAAGIVCLREVCVDGQLPNSCVCVRLGASELLEMNVFSSAVTAVGGQHAVLCFVQEDGAIHVLELRSDITSSILDTLVVSNEGGLVNLGGTVSSEIPAIGLANRRHHELKGLSAKAVGGSLTAYSGSVQSLPADRDIESAVWASAECLLLGLSHGDVLLVQLNRRQQTGGSTTLQLREHVLRDRGSGLKALWSEFLGGAADSNCDTICLASQAASALAVNRSGELRQWNIESEELVSQTSLFDLLDAVGAVSGLVAGRAGASTLPSAPGQGGAVDRNIHLQDCVVRLGQDCVGANSSNSYLLGALAVLPEDCAGGSGSGSGLTGRAVPSAQQRWQILLVAWKEASEASMRPSEKVKLVAQPIKFPIGSLVVGPNQTSANPTLVGYRYTAAALVDLQLVVDSVRGEAAVVTVWRAVATRRTSVGEDSVELEGLVCRSVLQLADLRAQEFTPPGSTGAGPRRTEELAAASEMQIVLHSAAHDRLRMLSEDRAILRMAEESWAATDLADQRALTRAEGQLRATLLQRIFLPHRYSGRVICSAYDTFRARNRALLPDEAALWGGRGVEECKNAWIATAALDKQTPVSELTHLVLLLCEGAAKMKFSAAGTAVLSNGVSLAQHRAGLEEQELRWRKQFLPYVCESFSEFLADCEALSRRMVALNVGCTVCVARGGEHVAVKALRDGDIALVSSVTALLEGPIVGEHVEQATELMLVTEELFVRDEALRLDFLELDCLMDKYLQAGDISEASAEWIPHYFASLAPGLRCLLPQLLNLLQSEGDGELSCYDALVRHCSLPGELSGLLSASSGVFDCLLGPGAGGGADVAASATPTPSDVAMIYQHALRSARLYLQRSKLVLSLLSLVVEVGQPLLCADTYSAIRNEHIPMVVHNVLHFSLLLWLDARRPTDNHMLVHEVELASIFPLSVIMSTPTASVGENSAATKAVRTRSSAAFKSERGISVFENFVRHLHMGAAAQTQIQSVSRLFSAVRLSAHSELTRYLFHSGQYVGLSRWAALTELVQAPFALCTSHLDRHGGGVEELLVSIGRCRICITKLTAEYLELLRCQWYHLQHPSHSHAQSASSGPLSAIKMKVHELLAATQELNTLADCALSSAYHSGDATLSPVAGDHRRAFPAADIAQGMVLHLRSEWGGRCANAHGLGSQRSEWHVRSHLHHLEGMLALADAVVYVGSIGKGASMIRVLTDSTALGEGADGAARDLLAHRMSELCRTLHLSSVSSVLEMLDRALFFLPRKEGSALAMDGAIRLVGHVSGTLDAVTQRSGLDRQSCSQILLAELHGAWSRVFEYALLHGERYTEALDALLRVAELEEQRLLDVDVLSASAAVPWRGCLRTLVAQACDMGQLGWLCSIPDRQLQGFAKQGFSLCTAIAATLEELAVTLDTPSSMNFNEANYFECLFVFHLSRHNYHDAARVMHKLLERKASAGLGVELEPQVGYSAASLAALAALPGDQRFILHKLSAAGRNRDDSGVSGMQCLDERQLSMLFANKASTCKLASSSVANPVGQAESADQLVVALGNAGRIHDALSLAWTYTRTAATCSNSPVAAPGECLTSVPVISLAKQCVVGGPNGSTERDFFLHAPFHTGSVPMSQQTQAAEQPWRQLSAILSSLHRAGSSQNLHEVALRALLFFHQQQNESESAPLPLPRTLVDVLAGLSSPVSANPAAQPLVAPVGDPALLLRTLMEFDSREEACLLATRLLGAANEQLQLQSPERRGSAALGRDPSGCCGWMPYPTLDQLIAHCATPHVGASAEQQQRDRVALDGLSGALEQHFSLWLFR